MVKIRLSRVGKKKVPFYRIVAVDSRRKRDGGVLETIGSFDGLSGKLTKFNQERMDYWVSQGAVTSDAVKRLHKVYTKSAEKKA